MARGRLANDPTNKGAEENQQQKKKKDNKKSKKKTQNKSHVHVSLPQPAEAAISWQNQLSTLSTFLSLSITVSIRTTLF